MGSPKIVAVDNLNGGTPVMTIEEFNKKKAEIFARKQAALAEEKALEAAAGDILEANSAQVSAVRFDAWKIRREIEPLEAEYARLSNEYTDLVGSPGVNPDGSRKLAKIKFGTDEVKAFETRHKAGKK